MSPMEALGEVLKGIRSKFASEELKTGGKVTVRRLADADITITYESGLRAYKEGFNKLQRDLNRKLIK